jgi:hypothetical protein
MLSDKNLSWFISQSFNNEYASRLLNAVWVLGKASRRALVCYVSKLLNQARAAPLALSIASCLI